MLSQTLLAFIDYRCREGNPSTCHLPFGGKAILLVGDPAQLPPVMGTSLWTKTLKSKEQRDGWTLYQLFQIVVKLNIVVRQDREQERFKLFLHNMRDGNNTKDDWEWLIKNCTPQHMTEEHKNRFKSLNTIAIYNTNSQVQEFNVKQLINLGYPITKIDALNIGEGAINGNSEQTQNLDNFLYISHGSKIVLTYNTSTENGLVNGSTGIVKDIIYLNDSKPPMLPTYIIVDIPSYRGPKFFQEDNRETWIIFKPRMITWDIYVRNKSITCSRTMFPFRLAWAWTPWKSQGSTFCDPIIIYPGNKEVDHGVSYVTFSRATKIDNIYIPDGIEMDRLCLKIKSSKKMTSRIEEEKRLQKLHDVTISKKHICINCFLCVCTCVCNGIQETNTEAMTQCQFCI